MRVMVFVMQWLLLALAAGVVYVISRKPGQPSPDSIAKPLPEKADTKWYTIMPQRTGVPLTAAMTSRPLVMGDIVNRVVGDGHMAKPGEDVTPENSRAVAVLTLKVILGPFTRDGHTAYTTRVLSASLTKGDAKLAPPLPAFGHEYADRRDSLIAAV